MQDGSIKTIKKIETKRKFHNDELYSWCPSQPRRITCIVLKKSRGTD